MISSPGNSSQTSAQLSTFLFFVNFPIIVPQVKHSISPNAQKDFSANGVGQGNEFPCERCGKVFFERKRRAFAFPNGDFKIGRCHARSLLTKNGLAHALAFTGRSTILR